jgi:hypothetical protein
MSAAVGMIGAGQAARPLTRDPAPNPQRPVLPAPEEQAFKVSTINERLASLAAERKGVDLKA